MQTIVYVDGYNFYHAYPVASQNYEHDALSGKKARVLSIPFSKR